MTFVSKNLMDEDIFVTKLSSCLLTSHSQRCCQNATVSECDSVGSDGPGVDDADFVLYVSANNTGSCMQDASTGGELIAFATHCQQEAALDR